MHFFGVNSYYANVLMTPLQGVQLSCQKNFVANLVQVLTNNDFKMRFLKVSFGLSTPTHPLKPKKGLFAIFAITPSILDIETSKTQDMNRDTQGQLKQAFLYLSFCYNPEICHFLPKNSHFFNTIIFWTTVDHSYLSNLFSFKNKD